MRHSIKNRVLSGLMSFVIAVGFVLSTAIPDIFSHTVMAAAVPPVQDSASAVNYATILGRATDFGIVANEFHHENHMETTIAVNDYYQMDGMVTDVDFVEGTAQFIVAHVEEGYFALGSKQKCTTYNIEASEDLYYAENPNAADNPTFVYPIPSGDSTKGKGKVGYFYIDYDFTTQNTELGYDQTLDVYPVATSTVEGNVARIIGNMQEKSAEIDMKANDEGYKIDYKQYKTTDAKYTLDFTQGDFVNKVIYINVDSELADKIAEGQLYLKKDDSTIICFNYPETGAEVKIGRMYVWDSTGNKWVSSVTGSSGATSTEDHTNDETDKLINQKIIYNIQTSGKVTLDAAGGTFLVPKDTSNTEVIGSSTGWIVTAGSMVNHAEWHYIYKGISQESMKDGVGQIHFAARKAFTHGYDGADTYEDKTIFCNAGAFTFAWYETGSDYSISGLTPVKDNIKNQATNTIKFPTLSFYTDASKAGSDTDHLVLDGETKDFYYKVVETSSNVATLNGKNVSKSDGWINIHLQVTNKGGFLYYTVSSETRLGDAGNTVYKKNDNVGMSGVEFNLGAFFNLIEDQNTTAIDIVKTDDNGMTLSGANFKLTGKNAANEDIIFNPSQLDLGKDAKVISTTTSIEFMTGSEPTTIKHLDDGTYTLEEVGAPYGYDPAPTYVFNVNNGVVELVSPANGSTEANGSAFTAATAGANAVFALVDKEDTTVTYSDVEISKVIAGGTTELKGAELTLSGKLENGNTITFSQSQFKGASDAKFVSAGDTLTFTSGSSSSVINGLPDGTYTLREDIAPDGYQISTDIIFTISNGTVTGSTVTSSSTAAGKVVMEDAVSATNVDFAKTNETDTITLNGAEFELTGTYPSGNSISFTNNNISLGAGATIKSTGNSLVFATGTEKSTFTDLPDGSYLLKELTGPNGYACAPELRLTISGNTVSIPNGVTNVDVSANSIKIKDKDSKNNVKFVKTDSTNDSVKIEDVTIELTGIYPDGITSITFNNSNISGAKSTDLSDDKVLKFVTGSSEIEFKELPNGTYTLTETACPDTYNLASPITFTVKDGEVTSQNGTIKINPYNQEKSIVLYDVPKTIETFDKDVYFRKIDGDGNYVDGATITITGLYVSGDSVDLSGVTVENYDGTPATYTATAASITITTGTQTVKIKNLPKANYTFSESGTPDNYLKAADISFDGKTQGNGIDLYGFSDDNNQYVNNAMRVTMKDLKKVEGQIVITKTINDADVNSLGAITFKVTDSNGVVVKDNITFSASTWTKNGDTYSYTLTDGIISGAKYTVTETKDGSNDKYTCTATSSAPTDGTVTAVAVGADGATAAFTNTYKNNPGSFKITKTLVGAELSELTGNIKFSIINKDTGATVKTVYLSSLNSTDWKYENGAYVCTIGNLPAGTYTVEETENANAITTKIDGSEQTSKDVTVNSGSVASVAVTNNYSTTAPTGTIEVTKSLDGASTTTATDYYVVLSSGTDYYNLDGTVAASAAAAVQTISVTGTSDSITYTGLDTSKTYTVTETNASGVAVSGASSVATIGGYTWTSTGSTIVATVNSTDFNATTHAATAEITNKYEQNTAPTGKLTITKTVDGDGLTPDEYKDKLTFQVYNETTGMYIDKDGKETSSQVSFTMFDAGFTYDSSTKVWSKTFENLKDGKYTVTEVNKDIPGYDFDYSAPGIKTEGDATIANGNAVAVDLKDVYKNTTVTTGKLTLKKSVTGCDALLNTPVNFYVKDASGNYYDASGNNCGSVKTAITVTPSTPVDVPLPDGTYTISEDAPTASDYILKDDSVTTVTLDNFKAADGATVTLENNYKKNVQPTVIPTVTPGPTAAPTVAPTVVPTVAPTVAPTGAPAPIPGTVSVPISKQDVGGLEINGAVLTIVNADGFSNDLSGVTVTQNGQPASGLVVSADSVSFTTVESSSAIVSGLPVGTYVLTETVVPIGYVVAESITFRVDTEGSVWVCGTPEEKVQSIVMIDRTDPIVSQVKVDDVVVPPENYTVNPDKTVTLKDDYTKTLVAGVHRITITYTDGTETTVEITITAGAAKVPATGEGSDYLMIAGAVALISSAAVALAYTFYKRWREED